MPLDSNFDHPVDLGTKTATIERIATNGSGWRLGCGLNLPDAELVRRLEARDGPLGSHWRPHSNGHGCRYQQHYSEHDCPWCTAERRRDETDWRRRHVA